MRQNASINNDAKKRASELLAKMTLSEKIAQMMQIPYNFSSRDEQDLFIERGVGSFLHVLGEDARQLQEKSLKTRLGIPLIFGIDCVRGHALNQKATVFPSQLGMASAFNPELVYKAGRVSAKEVAADGLHWVFSPVVCLGRDTRWGRVDETFGEDPYTAGVLSKALTSGYQGDDLNSPDSVLACAKHFIAHGESSGGRDSYDASVTKRKVREVFFPPFKMALDAGCGSVMTAYHSIDSLPCTANKWLLRDLLKNENSFEGFVVTDWDNVGHLIYDLHTAKDYKEAARMAIEAGNDMIMSTPAFYDAALSLAQSGEVDIKLIDEAVLRILTTKFKLGLFDGRALNQSIQDNNVFACAEHMDINQEITNQSFILLENKNNTLPFCHDTLKNIKKLAITGPLADNVRDQYGDWTFFTHPTQDFNRKPLAEYVTVWEGIKAICEKNGIESVYSKGCGVTLEEGEDIKEALNVCEGADAVVAVIGDCVTQNGEVKDRANLDLPENQQLLLQELKKAGHKLIVIVISGKPLTIPWVKENADALIWAFSPGMLGGAAAASILFGEVNPSGKLPISIPHHVGQLPVYYNQLPGWHGDGKYIDMPKEPLYSFGYGLSYSKFTYSGLYYDEKVSVSAIEFNVGFTVANESGLDGDEVVFIFINDVVSSRVTPVKSLVEFKRVFIKAGERVRLDFTIPTERLAVYLDDEEAIVEPGEFELIIGTEPNILKGSFEAVK